MQRMKTKWGSCNHRAGNIRLNTELVKKPKDLVEYVVVHEMLHLLEPTHNERFVALLALGLAFALAYPRRIAEAALLVVAAAVSFELLQALDPSRHARLGDVAVKVVGGLTGILLGTLVLWRRNALDAQVPFLSWLFRRR